MDFPQYFFSDAAVALFESPADLFQTQLEAEMVALLDINKDQTAYLNRIDVFAKGEGYGAEIIKHIKAEAKAKGITSIKAYIEHLNSASKSMIRKAGFTEAKEEKHGSYWVVTL